MADGKKSFVLYADLIHLVRKLPKDTRADLFLHILEYVNDLNPAIKDNILLEVSFEPIKQQLKRDLKDWERTLLAKSEGGKKSAAMRKQLKDIQDDVSMLKIVKDSPRNSTVNVNDNVTVNVNDTVTISKKEKIQEMTEIEFTEFSHKMQNDKIFTQALFTGGVKPEHLEKWITHFHIQIVGDGNIKKDYVEYRKHFKNWLKKQDYSGKPPALNGKVVAYKQKDTSGGYDTGIRDSSIYDEMK